MPPTLPSSEAPIPPPWRRLLATPWLRPLNDPVAIDDLLSLWDATWSLTTIKARVVDAIRETAAARTLVLQPNRLWPGHRSGQHVRVQVELDGRLMARTFSLSSPPRADGLVAITVQRREGGRVSHWWNDDAAVGDVVTLGPPSGDFVLPSPLPPRLLMLSAGSGITPLMAMLRELDARGAGTDLLFVHSARSKSDAIFAAELEGIASRRPWLELRHHFSAGRGRMDSAAFAAIAGEAPGAAAFVCGPPGFMDEARAAWRHAGCESLLSFEHFGLPSRGGDPSQAIAVEAARSRKIFVAAGGQSLLEAAEAAGLKPAHGCRIGICHTCKCRKLSGTVGDLRDGRMSSEPGEMIQLCVTTPLTPVTLEL